jgi:hypothetical protein
MLSYQISGFESDDWARKMFEETELGDKRRSRRTVNFAQAMAEHPGLSIPRLCDTAYEVKATYTFLSCSEVIPDRLHAPHRKAVAEKLSIAGTTFLLIEDTTSMSWSGSKPIRGLGPIGTGKEREQGFLLHSTLAVHWTSPEVGQTKRPPVEVIGLADQIYQVRTPRPKTENKQDSRARKNRPRESELWMQAGAHLGEAPAGVRWEQVCDRGADIYEFLIQCRGLKHGFIVRAAQDRTLVDDKGCVQGRLFDIVQQANVLGSFELHLRARPKCPARTACLSVSGVSVVLRSPIRPGYKRGQLPPVECTVVRVFEPEPPPGVKPLEWVLLTDSAVDTFEAAMEVALKYSARWLIEVFHKALKTGLGAERLQLETAERLFAAIALMSLVAFRLIALQEALRLSPDAPADTAGLSTLELQVLRAKLKRPINTVREVALAIGRLGGHMNRKADGLPGWKTLWLGMNQLHLLVQGVLLASSLPKFGV